MPSKLFAAVRALFSDHNIPEYDNDAQIFAALRYQYFATEEQFSQLINAVGLPSLNNPDQLIIDTTLGLKPTLSQWGWVLPIYAQSNTIIVASSNPFWRAYENIGVSYIYCPESVIVTTLLEKQGSPWQWLEAQCRPYSFSDIHIQSGQKFAVIKLRINGNIHTLCHLSMVHYNTILNIIKLIAHMNVGVQNSPQDGSFSGGEGHRGKTTSYMFRAATFPTPHGEDIALRKIDSQTQLRSLDSLGFSGQSLDQLKHMCQRESGLVLVTGPTGSGKSTTLYAILSHLQSTLNKLIVTLEDPIESEVEGVRQSQINDAGGYTFQRGLKALLRQDPDIIMIGEIRDQDTALTALHAAYTGHLVLASLHTSSCEASLMRLLSFKCDPFLLSHCLKGIISQRLIPMPCTREHIPNANCSVCMGSGVSGRVLISENLHITSPVYSPNSETLRENIMNQNTYISFKQDLKSKGLQSIMVPHDI